MSDEPTDKPTDKPEPRPVGRAPVVDEGLASWGGIVRDALSAQGGVEVIGAGGGTVGFKFRGQTFAVSIVRIG